MSGCLDRLSVMSVPQTLCRETSPLTFLFRRVMSNLKEIKDAARQAFRDQQLQDTEGGVPDAVSFCAGFLAGFRHIQAEIDELTSVLDLKKETLVELEAKNKTHLENFKEMLVSIGYTPELVVEDNKTMITLSSNRDKVHGYMGFVAHFEFKEDGSLDNVGIYE